MLILNFYTAMVKDVLTKRLVTLIKKQDSFHSNELGNIYQRRCKIFFFGYFLWWSVSSHQSLYGSFTHILITLFCKFPKYSLDLINKQMDDCARNDFEVHPTIHLVCMKKGVLELALDKKKINQRIDYVRTCLCKI